MQFVFLITLRLLVCVCVCVCMRDFCSSELDGLLTIKESDEFRNKENSKKNIC